MKYSALHSLLRTKSKVLIIHSDDDKVVSCKKHFDVMHKALVGYENITFWKVSGKGHNPNYTADAVKYKDAFFKRYQSFLQLLRSRLAYPYPKNSFRTRLRYCPQSRCYEGQGLRC